MWRSALLLLFGALAGLAPSEPATGSPNTDSAGPSRDARVLAAGDALPLRAAGRPGDFLLTSPVARAVVRKRDAALVDFFRVPLAEASVPQLRGERFLDGLTSFRPFLRAGHVERDLRAHPRLEQGQVRSEEELTLAGARLRVTTTYALSASEPLLDVVTRVEHVGGSSLEALAIGERVRWGNSDYFVNGRRSRDSFSGNVFEVGRKGAGGDLVLIPASGRMSVVFQSTQPGLMGELVVEHGRFPLGRVKEKLIRRTLVYRPLAAPPPAIGSAVLDVTLTDERDRPLAGKLTLRGLGDTPDPNFGDDGDEHGANRFVYSGNGRLRRNLAPGRYRVLASSGIERDVVSWDLTLAPGRVERRHARLPRLIDTPGRIAADLHLHQAASPDADIANTTRVISIAAEGVELAVASDHYAVGDLAPAVAELTRTGALTSRLIVVPGSEVTTQAPDFGHFNVFPLGSTAGIPDEGTTPRQLFAAVRRVAPGALLQVNHPRWPRSLFSRYPHDPSSGRVRPSLAGEYSDDFDALEVFNGFDAWSDAIVRNVLRDYLRLVAAGKRYTATGNSDSHGLFFVDPGMPRNLVRYGTARDDDADLDVEPAVVLDAIRRGRVVVTNGPVLDVEIDGVGPGGTRRSGGKPVELQLAVRAAPWIDVSSVEILRGSGEQIRRLPIAPSRDVLRLRYRTDLPGSGTTFYVVVARGKAALPNVYRAGVRPFAFTNPIFVEP